MVSGTDIFNKEIKGLELLKDSLDESFNRAVDYLSNNSGRVIISGVGKSGHIGTKIASTFSSLGIPSFFIHPTEAAHGDLGMITKDDIVLSISKSGETSELLPLLEYTKRFGITLICITSNPQSTLAEYSNISLILPKTEEACPHNLAPTTSTTMALVLGDALAIVSCSRSGFTKESFNNFHPGGTLGKQLKKVSDIMWIGELIPYVYDTDLMTNAILEMSTKRGGVAGVINNQQKLLGVITDGDVRRHLTPELIISTVKDVMTLNPITIKKNQLCQDALYIMQNRAVTSLFIVDDNNYLEGAIHIHDLLHLDII